jgi:hypothetical protein
MSFSPDTRAWLARVGLSLLIALAAGGLAYLVARAIGSVYLFYQQQQFYREVAELLRGGGVEALAGSNLRQLRRQVAQLNAQYNLVCAQIGFGCAAVAAAVSYLRLERRAHP